uniref:C2H2-type domain-containing protein n=1 Tax=Heterorhabditis bacteriophora TaxID=37862 RepID=A0A1I7WPP9_HETBA
MPVKESMGNEDPTYPCKICGRRFIQNSLVRNIDLRKNRSSKLGISKIILIVIYCILSVLKTFLDYPIPPPPKWVDNEATSDEDFLNTTVYMETNDYVQCEYCGRNFNEKAAERHIPFCRDQNMRRGGGSLKPVAKPLTGHRLSTGRQEIKMREASPSRQTEMRWRGESREDTKNTPTSRRKSTDARPTPQSRHSPARNTSQSAGQRHTVVPPTPNKRSNSAPRTPAASRLKTPGFSNENAQLEVLRSQCDCPILHTISSPPSDYYTVKEYYKQTVKV